jgi:hypothetical protein
MNKDVKTPLGYKLTASNTPKTGEINNPNQKIGQPNYLGAYINNIIIDSEISFQVHYSEKVQIRN